MYMSSSEFSNDIYLRFTKQAKLGGKLSRKCVKEMMEKSLIFYNLLILKVE